MIKVSHLSKNYGEIEAINDISFEINKGEVVGLLGPNGAGKTTTMKIITGFMKANKGNIIIGNKELEKNKHEIQKDIGYLPENCPLYEEITIMEHLEFTANMKGINPATKNDEIKRVLNLCGLEDRKQMIIAQLSKGYKQRTGLACALLGNPAILILDEPTSGLDPNQILEIRKLLSNIAKTTKATIILSTHIMQEAESTCDRVIIIHKGSIVADGTIKSLQDRSKKGIAIEFETSASPTEAKATLVKMKNVIDYETKGKEGKNNIISANFEAKKDDIPNILEALIKAKLPIYRFKPYTESLESIFSSLTQN